MDESGSFCRFQSFIDLWTEIPFSLVSYLQCLFTITISVSLDGIVRVCTMFPFSDLLLQGEKQQQGCWNVALLPNTACMCWGWGWGVLVKCARVNTQQFSFERLSDFLQEVATRCNTLQRPGTHCNTLQHTATHCNTLQHTATRSFERLSGSLDLSGVQNDHTPKWPHSSTHIHTHTDTHTHIHSRTHTHARTHSQTHTHTHTQTRTHAHRHTLTHTHSHTHVNIHTRTHIHTHTKRVV